MIATLPNPTPQAPQSSHSAVGTLWRALLLGFRPPAQMTCSEWARKYRRLATDSAYKTGQFDPFPYQVEPMDAPSDADVVETVLWWASQTGKTEVILSRVGYHMDADPAPQLLVQPTIDLMKAFSEERIAPEIRENRRLRALVRDPRSRDSGNKILSKRYPGGNLAMVGANSPSGLAGRPRRVVLQDEVDRYPQSAGTEGDPVALADKRTESFPNAIKIKTSTATVKGLSKIEKLTQLSDFRKWFVTHKCGAEYLFMWAQVKWPESKPEEAYMECPHCGGRIDDDERKRMVKCGKWKATQPFRGIRGYWLNGLNTLFKPHKGFRNRIHQFAAEFLKAKDTGPDALKVWINTFLAETYEEDADALDANVMQERGEDYESTALPEGVLLLTAGADVQRMRIECEIKGWGIDEECWGVRKVVLDGDTEKDEVWQQLDEVLLSEFDREDGAKLKILRAFVDMGYRSKQVLKFCAPRIGRGVYPCRGINRVGTNPPPLLPAQPNRNNKARIPHWNVGVTVAKTTIYDRLKMEPGGPRTVHFPKADGYDAEHFRQFASEKRKLKYSAGVPYYIFEKLNNSVRNEALDLFVYAFAAMHSLMPIFWRRVAAARKKQAEKRTAEPNAPATEAQDDAVAKDTEDEGKPVSYTEQRVAQQMRQMKRRIRGRGGFVGRW